MKYRGESFRGRLNSMLTRQHGAIMYIVINLSVLNYPLSIASKAGTTAILPIQKPINDKHSTF